MRKDYLEVPSLVGTGNQELEVHTYVYFFLQLEPGPLYAYIYIYIGQALGASTNCDSNKGTITLPRARLKDSIHVLPGDQ